MGGGGTDVAPSSASSASASGTSHHHQQLPFASAPNGWSEFCERHARAAAADFAKSCVHYINKNLAENVRASVSHREFMQKFVDCFSEQFDAEYTRRRTQTKVRRRVFNVDVECDVMIICPFARIAGERQSTEPCARRERRGHTEQRHSDGRLTVRTGRIDRHEDQQSQAVLPSTVL